MTYAPVEIAFRGEESETIDRLRRGVSVEREVDAATRCVERRLDRARQALVHRRKKRHFLNGLWLLNSTGGWLGAESCIVRRAQVNRRHGCLAGLHRCGRGLRDSALTIGEPGEGRHHGQDHDEKHAAPFHLLDPLQSRSLCAQFLPVLPLPYPFVSCHRVEL